MNQPHWSLNDDKTRLRVLFPTTPPVAFDMDTDEVDDLIGNLAEMRANMLPGVEMTDPDPGTRLNVATNGRWYVQPTPDGGAALCILHPGYRWVAMRLDAGAAGQLVQILQSLQLPPQAR